MEPVNQTTEYKIFTLKDWEILSEESKTLQGQELMHLWKLVNKHKYDGDLYLGDIGNHEFVFRLIELPIIKKIYPEEVVKLYVRKWATQLFKLASKRKSDTDFDTLRKSGMPFLKAREHATNERWSKLYQKYSQPYKFVYVMTSEMADQLCVSGIELFTKLNYDKFCVPVQSRKDTTAKQQATRRTPQQEE